MELGLVLTLCGLGVSFLLPALILMIISISRKKKCTANAYALIIDIKANHSGDEGITFYPVYEYRVGGVIYTGTGASMSHHVPQINTYVSIMYNPNNPRQSYIQGYDNKVFRILSIVFTVIGVIPIIICIGIVLFA